MKNETLNMARKPKRNPSFFKILLGDFYNKLRIPPVFMKYVFKGNVPAMFTLYSSDSWNSSWQVRVRVEQGNYFLIGGWSKFVKDHGLEIGDFLVFFLLGGGTFDVHIYDRSACAKNTIVAAKKRKAGRPPVVNRQIDETPTKRCSSVSNKARGASRAANFSQETEFRSEVITKSVSFVMVVKKRHKYHACIPRYFARGSGFRKESITKIKDPRGRIWPMNTTVSGGKIRVGGGWSRFVHENGIVIGDTLLFEHIPNTSNLIQVQVVEKAGYENHGRQNKQAIAGEKDASVVANRRRGRPCRQVEEPPSKKCAPSSKRMKELISDQQATVVVLKDYQMYSVFVPRGFAKEMGLAEKPSTVVKDSKGRMWTVNILMDKKTIRLGAGWSKFVEDNNLEVGDSLLFRHIPNTGNVINFKIIDKAGGGKRNERANV